MHLDYSVQFEDPLYTVHESFDTFTFFVVTTRAGSPSHNATVSFIRDDSGPTINDLVVSTTGSLHIQAQIPNDEIRLGDRTINLMLTTVDDLVEIGARSQTAVDVTEDDRKSVGYHCVPTDT